MTVIKCKPTSPGRRHMVKVKNNKLYNGRPYSLLTKNHKKRGGRNNSGKITVRHVGGEHKRKYRLIDFKRNKVNIIGTIQRIEYDPNRSSNIALVLYKDGERRYILEPNLLNVGDKIQSGPEVPIKVGNTTSINRIPVGSNIHNIELKPGKGGQIARSAGSYAQVLSKDKFYVTVRLKSGEIRKIFHRCNATIGEIGNKEHMLRSFGKAGSKRWIGIRPTVRGTAMNPVDHPHGGGEGKNFGKHPVSPWGKKTKGKKTRRNKRTEKYIIHRMTKK
ncbi:50S ribosomal protein L2 [Candidatus Riesia sp. GBBU]|nr:50S ribosomal protein L2 [Candidatus Riesia sp. GBBU]